MSVPKWILFGSVALFSLIGIAAIVKKSGKKLDASVENQQAAKQIEPAIETSVLSVPVSNIPPEIKAYEKTKKRNKDKKSNKALPDLQTSQPIEKPNLISKDDFPNIDRIHQLFSSSSSKLPIVETVNYSSSVSWLKGRPAWIADYATYYNTSRHFIARSLNGKPDYFSQKVSEGRKFNVFRKDKNFQFFLLVDVSRCKMGFYYIDLDTNERVLLKTYKVGLGQLDPSKPSGTLTPMGRYKIGSRVAIYKPGMMGYYHDKEVEMIRIFGTRWLPFEQEVERTTAPAKGYGLHGAPWLQNQNGQLVENKEMIGVYGSDGCIRLSSEDMEELFAIVLTKPTYIEIVKDFHEAKLPGTEVATPSR